MREYLKNQAKPAMISTDTRLPGYLEHEKAAIARDFLLPKQREAAGLAEADLRLGDDALAALAAYAWPGNVRELHNLIERLAVLHPDATIRAADLPPRYRAAWEANGGTTVAPALADTESFAAAPDAPSSVPLTEGEQLAAERAALFGISGAPALDELPEDGLDLKEHIAAIEERLLRQALDRAAGVVAQAANLLRLRRTTLVEKLRKYGIEREDGDG